MLTASWIAPEASLSDSRLNLNANSTNFGKNHFYVSTTTEYGIWKMKIPRRLSADFKKEPLSRRGK
jgi:hypothetical protein